MAAGSRRGPQYPSPGKGCQLSRISLSSPHTTRRTSRKARSASFRAADNAWSLRRRDASARHLPEQPVFCRPVMGVLQTGQGRSGYFTMWPSFLHMRFVTKKRDVPYLRGMDGGEMPHSTPLPGFTASTGLLGFFCPCSQTRQRPKSHWPSSRGCPQLSHRSMPWYCTSKWPHARTEPWWFVHRGAVGRLLSGRRGTIQLLLEENCVGLLHNIRGDRASRGAGGLMVKNGHDPDIRRPPSWSFHARIPATPSVRPTSPFDSVIHSPAPRSGRPPSSFSVLSGVTSIVCSSDSPSLASALPSSTIETEAGPEE